MFVKEWVKCIYNYLAWLKSFAENRVNSENVLFTNFFIKNSTIKKNINFKHLCQLIIICKLGFVNLDFHIKN